MDGSSNFDEARQAELALAGGATISVVYRDGRQEDVQVKLLSFRELATYDGILMDEAAQVELFCGKPKGWADTLLPSSHAAIIEHGERINETPFVQWVTRTRARATRLAPILRQAMG